MSGHYGDGVTEIVKYVETVQLDPEQPNVKVYDYEYYKVVTSWKEYDNDEIEECEYYYAIEIERDDEELEQELSEPLGS